MDNIELLKEYVDNEDNIYFIFKTARMDQSKLQKPLTVRSWRSHSNDLQMVKWKHEKCVEDTVASA